MCYSAPRPAARFWLETFEARDDDPKKADAIPVQYSGIWLETLCRVDASWNHLRPAAVPENSSSASYACLNSAWLRRTACKVPCKGSCWEREPLVMLSHESTLCPDRSNSIKWIVKAEAAFHLSAWACPRFHNCVPATRRAMAMHLAPATSHPACEVWATASGVWFKHITQAGRLSMVF